MKFKYYEKEFSVSEGREKFNVIKKEFEIKSKELVDIYSKKYDGFKNIDNFIENTEEVFGDIVLSGSGLANKILIMNKISNYSGETILKDNIKTISKCFMESLDEVGEKYIDTIEEEKDREKFREKRRVSRKKWGIEECIDIELRKDEDENSFNMATGISNEKGNVIGKTISTISNAYKKKVLYKESKDKLVNGVLVAVQSLMKITIEILKENNIEIDMVSNGDEKEVKSIIENLSNAEDKKEVLLKCLNINPYDTDIYVNLINIFGDKDKEIQKIGDYFSIELIQYKREVIKKFFEELDLSTEEKVKEAREQLEEKIIFIGSFGDEYLEKIDEKLKEYDIKARTVDGKLFSTREEAEKAKEELNKIIAIKGDMNINSEVSVENAIVKINEEEFKTEIKDKYLKELEDLRLKAIRYEDNMLLENRFSLDAVIDEETAVLMEEDIQNLILRSKDLIENRLQEIRDKKEKIIYKADKETLEEKCDNIFALNEDEVLKEIEEIKALNLRSEKLVEDKVKHLQKNMKKIISNNIKLVEKAERYEQKINETGVAIKEKNIFKKAIELGKDMVENIVTSGDKAIWEKITKNGEISIMEIKLRIR